MEDLMNQAKKNLHEVFGFSEFRNKQEEAIQKVFQKENILLVLPTGAGKSLCYQLPGLSFSGLTIVISPNAALMRDQVKNLEGFGIEALYLNNDWSDYDKRQIIKKIQEGKIKFLYATPEKITRSFVMDWLKDIEVSFIAIDEAHNVSQKSHDFKKDYTLLSTWLKEFYPKVLRIAVTATANQNVREDIQKAFGIDTVLSDSFYRNNLHIEIRSSFKQNDDILNYIRTQKRKKGIIYCHSRDTVEFVSDTMKNQGIKAVAYHAGQTAAMRIMSQKAFTSGEADLMITTLSFGIGIDVPDIRYIIHYNLPKSLDSYYQEIGRAGRDGKPSDCILYFDPEDLNRREHELEFVSDPDMRETMERRNQELAEFCQSHACRWKYLLNIFEDLNFEKCENCDMCLLPEGSVDVSRIASKIFSCLKGKEFPYDIALLIEVCADEAYTPEKIDEIIRKLAKEKYLLLTKNQKKIQSIKAIALDHIKKNQKLFISL